MRRIVVRIKATILVTEEQKHELASIGQSRSLPAGYVFRAKLILLLSEGATFAMIRQRLGTTNPTIIRWKERFMAEGIDGFNTNHPGQKPYHLTAALRAKILSATRRKPVDGSTHWSCRKLANALGSAKMWFTACGVKLA